jgi:hypothetical protein
MGDTIIPLGNPTIQNKNTLKFKILIRLRTIFFQIQIVFNKPTLHLIMHLPLPLWQVQSSNQQ